MLIFKSLKSKNYRFFFTGQAFSNLGNLMKQVAVGWLVYRLTGSALLLGVLAFSREISAFIFSTIAGVLADRYNKHKLLMACQSLIAINAAVLAWLTLSNQINVAILIFLEILFGLISGLEMPSRHAFVNDLVEDKSYLTNAIALNSSLFNTARILGPALAGILIPVIGEGYCFLIYALASFSVVVFFTFIHYSPSKKPMGKRGRVLSFYIMLFMGALSLGSFIIGMVTDWIGAPMAVFVGSIGVLILAFIYGKNLPILRKRTYRAIKKSEIPFP
ncbi:MAG: MFS transporter [Cyclobacteriaceae bacterium]